MNNKGFMLILAMVALVMMAIFLPALVRLIENETKWAMKQKQASTAFHMSEQGLDRGMWKLQESDSVWSDASMGAAIAGYNFDVIYYSTGSEQKEGEYTVKFSSHSSGGVMVRSVGRDRSENEVRALEAILTKTGINAGLTSRGALAYKPGLIVHWGPVVNYTSITQSPSQYYPRKISKTFIKETGGGAWYDEDPNTPNGHDFYSTWPDPATYDYNTFQSKLGTPPTINFDELKAVAKACQIPRLKGKNSSGAAAGNDPVGSGYYDGSEDVDLGIADLVAPINNSDPLIFYCSTCVLYIDGTGDLDIKDEASQVRLRAIVVKGGDFDMNANNTPAYSSRIPVGAKTEYNHPTALTTWDALFDSTGEGNTYDIPEEVQLHAYVYVGGNVNNSGGGDPAMVGAIDILGTMSANNTIVYYDSTVSTAVPVTNVKPTIQYCREVNPATIQGLP